MAERRKLRPGTPFVGGGEREGTSMVSHIGDGRLMTGHADRDATCFGFSYPGTLTGGPRSVFSNPA
jgi:hypothetical protein